MKKVVSFIALSLAFVALGVLLGRSIFAKNNSSPQEQVNRPDLGKISMAWLDYHTNLQLLEENAAFLPQEYRETIAEECFTWSLGGAIESGVLVSAEKTADRNGNCYIEVVTDKNEKLFFRFNRFPLDPCIIDELWKNSMYSDEGGECLYLGFIDDVRD